METTERKKERKKKVKKVEEERNKEMDEIDMGCAVRREREICPVLTPLGFAIENNNKFF